MTALVTVVRHGRTAHNAAGRFQGWADVPLDETGHAQARLLAERLAGHAVRPSRLYSSDLARARQTAGHVSVATGLPVQPVAALREINIGSWEGLTFAELEAGVADAFRAWPVRGAPAGESLGDVARRVRGFFDSIELQDGEHVVLVTHGVAITALLCDVLGWEPAQAWASRRGAHENTALSTIEVDPAGGMRCPTLACALHLERLSV